MKKTILIAVFLGCLALSFADTTLNDAYSGAIRKVYQTGQFQQLYTTWFGAAPRPNPPCLKFFPAEVPRKSELKRVLDCGVVRIGVGLLNAPYSYIENGVLKGFDIDLAYVLTAAVAAQYNSTLRVQHTVVEDFNNDLPLGLQDGDFDVVLSDFTINEQRAATIDFTCSYVPAEIRILRSALDPSLQLNSIASINNPNVKVLLFTGTLLEGLARGLFPQATFIQITAGSKDVALADVLAAVESEQGHVTVLPEALITYHLATSTGCDGCSLIDVSFVPPFYKGVATAKSEICGRNNGGRARYCRRNNHDDDDD